MLTYFTNILEVENLLRPILLYVGEDITLVALGSLFFFFFCTLLKLLASRWRTFISVIISLCQRLSLTRSVRNKPRARSASIERRRRESPLEAEDERSESFAGGARGFAKQNRVFEHTHLPLCRPGVSIQRNHYRKNELNIAYFY